jgi:hypothetical protein
LLHLFCTSISRDIKIPELEFFKKRLKIELKQFKANVVTDFSGGSVILIESSALKKHTLEEPKTISKGLSLKKGIQ